MKNNRQHKKVQVSEIINTITNGVDGTGYLGFIITYPDGRIENRIYDYDRFSYERSLQQIRNQREIILVHYHLIDEKQRKI